MGTGVIAGLVFCDDDTLCAGLVDLPDPQSLAFNRSCAEPDPALGGGDGSAGRKEEALW